MLLKSALPYWKGSTIHMVATKDVECHSQDLRLGG